MRVRVGTFNVLNLVLPDRPYYQERPYSRGEYDRKLEWIGGQLRRMDPHIVGFQEVFHEAALREAVTRSGLFTPEQAIAPLAADANTGPQVGIASRLPFLEQPEAVADFPPEVTVGV